MACPEGMYADEVRTTSGLTAEHAYTLIPNQIAYGEWLSTAQSLLTRARREYVQYGTTKPAEDWTATETATWTTLGNEFDAMVGRYNDLPHPWDLLDTAMPAELIDRAVKLSEDIACLWQRITAEIEALGGKPIGTPDEAKRQGGNLGIFEKALIIGGILGGGFLVIYTVRAVQNRKKGPA